MKIYCVVSEFYDNGTVKAWITESEGDKIPNSTNKELKNKDVYFDFFKDKSKAVELCKEAKRA